jgi:hypothetical protein
MGDKDFDALPETVEGSQNFQFGHKVYFDSFMDLAIPPQEHN